MQGGKLTEAQLRQHHQSAWQSLRDGDLDGAWRKSRVLNTEVPGFAPGWEISSRAALAMNRREDALKLINRALTIDGDRFAFVSHKAYCLLALQRVDEALELLDNLKVDDLKQAAEFDALGNLYSLCKDQARALEYFEKAVTLEPTNSHFQMNTGLIRQTLGELDGAESAMSMAISLNPGDHQAWLHRSRLRRQTTSSNHVMDMEKLLEEGIDSWQGEANIRYAIAKEYEDLHDHAASFRHLKAGSAIRRRHMKHDARADLDAIDAIIGSFSKEFFDREIRGYESEEPIFILGLPRTGTTLVERILGSHSDVYAAGELNNFAENLIQQVQQSAPTMPTNRNQLIAAATGVNFESLGMAYIQSTRPHTGNTKRFIDKLPLNFLYCGLIARALPEATIIHLTRHPMDTCYAIYKTLFKQAYPFSYDLEELGQYYLAYRKLMQHWHDLMPGTIFDVSYEDLVANQEEVSRKLVARCRLEWDNSCLAFHKNPEPSMTASLTQVRQPIYSTSIGQWRNYREELRPLLDLFENAGLAV